MNLNFNKALWAAIAIGAAGAAPAQSVHHRRHTENTWRSLTYASGALGALGLIGHNGTLATVGTAGALYSGYRWQEDLKSRHRLERERAQTYSHRHLYYHGHHFVRRVKYRNGQKYYYFVRVS